MGRLSKVAPLNDVELAPPRVVDVHTVEECDEVLRRRVQAGRGTGEVTDAWLDERIRAAEALAEALKELNVTQHRGRAA